jgi:hypothetical protein
MGLKLAIVSALLLVSEVGGSHIVQRRESNALGFCHLATRHVIGASQKPRLPSKSGRASFTRSLLMRDRSAINSFHKGDIVLVTEDIKTR